MPRLGIIYTIGWVYFIVILTLKISFAYPTVVYIYVGYFSIWKAMNSIVAIYIDLMIVVLLLLLRPLDWIPNAYFYFENKCYPYVEVFEGMLIFY